VTGNVSKAITSLARTWSARYVTISQAGVRKPVTDSFAKLVAIGLVYRIMVILFGSLLVPVVILCAAAGGHRRLRRPGRDRPADADQHRGHQRHRAARLGAAREFG
jgi:Flp pilus assembly protein TadB